jgi:DNA replication protein DnaC
MPFTLLGRQFTFRVVTCQKCTDAAAVVESTRIEHKSKWQRYCAPEYQKNLPTALRMQGWVEEVLHWKRGPQGLLVIGDTRAGKTHVMWQLLRRLMEEEKCSVETLDAVTFRSGLVKAGREGETENYARKLVHADLLYCRVF